MKHREESSGSDLEKRLRSWVTDWNGQPMMRGEPPRDGIHCDVIYDAADRIEELKRVLSSVLAWQEPIAMVAPELGGAILAMSHARAVLEGGGK